MYADFYFKKAWNVLIERFSQDLLEQHSGNQRKIGCRSDNPDMCTFDYNENTKRIQRNVSHTSGNFGGRFDKKRVWENVTDDPLSKIK